MLRPTLARIASAVPLLFAIACGGAHKRAEAPDFTEKGWSGPSADGAQAKADPPIQSASRSDDVSAAKAAPADKPPAPLGDKPQTSSGTEADVVSGAALPPPPGGSKAAKPSKAKKPKSRKKPAKPE